MAATPLASWSEERLQRLARLERDQRRLHLGFCLCGAVALLVVARETTSAGRPAPRADAAAAPQPHDAAVTPHYGRTLLEAVDDDRDGRMLSTDDGCVDTEDGATDSAGDNCAAWYDSYSSYLGDRCTNINGGATDYDDDDFTAADMCCSCDGGYRAPTPKPTTQECTWAPTFATVV